MVEEGEALRISHPTYKFSKSGHKTSSYIVTTRYSHQFIHIVCDACGYVYCISDLIVSGS